MIHRPKVGNRKGIGVFKQTRCRKVPSIWPYFPIIARCVVSQLRVTPKRRLVTPKHIHAKWRQVNSKFVNFGAVKILAHQIIAPKQTDSEKEHRHDSSHPMLNRNEQRGRMGSVSTYHVQEIYQNCIRRTWRGTRPGKSRPVCKASPASTEKDRVLRRIRVLRRTLR